VRSVPPPISSRAPATPFRRPPRACGGDPSGSNNGRRETIRAHTLGAGSSRTLG
jgi:hypothetical protein